jgi:hypothetical protein
MQYYALHMNLHFLHTNIRSKNTTSSLTQLEIPHDWPPPHKPYDGILHLTDPKAHAATHYPQWKLITLPDEINYYLLLRNQRHFGQTISIGPLAQKLLKLFSTARMIHQTLIIYCKQSSNSVNKKLQPIRSRGM